ncbi:serine-enriched protein isoform X3 [Lepeophtheirus salmonis]|uniref:serine-enriched protein isoform X3 n=1 Tax=Lepeophtheirus salmonis TaxID=72036 RepID=UPI001AE55CAD|nr:serine-enriched protein-like isoform X4 [Lepeophtheirus salmonis]
MSIDPCVEVQYEGTVTMKNGDDENDEINYNSSFSNLEEYRDKKSLEIARNISIDEFDDSNIFENKSGLAEDLRFLASMPELCDVTFLVGDTREPVCAVKAVLAARSRVFNKLLWKNTHSCGNYYTKKKEISRQEKSKLKALIKRSSEPFLNMQSQISSQNLHQTLIIEEFEPDVFRQLIEYIHTGCVTLQPRTLLGLMNAADYYGLEELKRACSGFIQCCVNVDTVCALLATAERYIQYKCTKCLVQKVLEFVDENGNEVLNLGSFALLPQHVVRLIMAREELKADEFSKFQADPNSVDPLKLSPVKTTKKSNGRSMSVQSGGLDPYGSITTLSSSTSSAGFEKETLSVDGRSNTSRHSPSRCSSISRYSN